MQTVEQWTALKDWLGANGDWLNPLSGLTGVILTGLALRLNRGKYREPTLDQTLQNPDNWPDLMAQCAAGGKRHT